MMRRFATTLLLGLLFVLTRAGAEDHTVNSDGVPAITRGVSESMQKSVDEVITGQLDLAADTEASAALADDLAFFVRRHYLDQGYKQVNVSWALESAKVVIVVDEGVQRHVGKVEFLNNPGLDEKELKRYLLRPTNERVGKLKQHVPYVEAEVRAGLDLVLRYLLSQGYQDAAVDDPEAATADDGSTMITVTLHPGEQWHVGEVTLDGAPEDLAKEMLLDACALKDQVANEARIEAVRRQLEGVMQARGYFTAIVDVSSTRGSGQQLAVAFKASSGLLHEVEDIHVPDTFSRGAQRLVRSAFRPSIGHVFDASRMEMAYGRASATGIFEHLEMEPKVTGDGWLALEFDGAEAKRRSVALSGGYDTFLGLMLGLEYKNVNLWDQGGIFRVKVTGTQLGVLAGIQWQNPAIFGSPYALAVEFMPETFTFEGYTRHTAALRAALSRDFTRHLSAEVYLLSSVNAMSSDTLSDLEIGPLDYNLGVGGATVRYEGRDNPVSPTRGWFASASAETGFVSGGVTDVSYLRTQFAASWYHPLNRKWRTAAGVQSSSLISGEDVGFMPIELRNYNGGAKGVRSFAERELGPRAKDGTPLGGTQATTVSGEISYEVIKNLELAGFVDVGSLSTEKGSVMPKFDDLRYAAGMGLRYRLPFGPLRVDYGVNLNRRTGESFGALHVGFGFAF